MLATFVSRNFGRFFCFVATSSFFQPVAAYAAPVLERVVILERHGVRSPTKPPDALAKYASQPWPQWPVAPGELTSHGAEAMRAMGAGLRTRYVRLGVLPRAGCPARDALFVWVDNSDQRTRESGNAIAESLAPGCAIEAGHTPEVDRDPLFHPPESGVCFIDPQAASLALSRQLDTAMKSQPARYANALAALNEILEPGCKGDDCALSGPNSVNAKGKIDGPLPVAATLSENLFLEYAQGFPAEQIGWGRAGTPEKVAAVMALHEMESDLTRRTPLFAAHNGSLLAEQIAEFIDGRRDAKALAPVPAATRLLVLLGHDTNLSNIAGMLGITWRLPNEPDSTAPGTALAFDVWRNRGVETVRVVVLYQTLDQLRSAGPLGGEPSHVDIAVPGCAGRACSARALAQDLTRAIPPSCLEEGKKRKAIEGAD